MSQASICYVLWDMTMAPLPAGCSTTVGVDAIRALGSNYGATVAIKMVDGSLPVKKASEAKYGSKKAIKHENEKRESLLKAKSTTINILEVKIKILHLLMSFAFDAMRLNSQANLLFVGYSAVLNEAMQECANRKIFSKIVLVKSNDTMNIENKANTVSQRTSVNSLRPSLGFGGTSREPLNTFGIADINLDWEIICEALKKAPLGADNPASLTRPAMRADIHTGKPSHKSGSMMGYAPKASHMHSSIPAYGSIPTYAPNSPSSPNSPNSPLVPTPALDSAPVTASLLPCDATKTASTSVLTSASLIQSSTIFSQSLSGLPSADNIFYDFAESTESLNNNLKPLVNFETNSVGGIGNLPESKQSKKPLYISPMRRKIADYERLIYGAKENGFAPVHRNTVATEAEIGTKIERNYSNTESHKSTLHINTSLKSQNHAPTITANVQKSLATFSDLSITKPKTKTKTDNSLTINTCWRTQSTPLSYLQATGSSSEPLEALQPLEPIGTQMTPTADVAPITAPKPIVSTILTKPRTSGTIGSAPTNTKLDLKSDGSWFSRQGPTHIPILKIKPSSALGSASGSASDLGSDLGSDPKHHNLCVCTDEKNKQGKKENKEEKQEKQKTEEIEEKQEKQEKDANRREEKKAFCALLKTKDTKVQTAALLFYEALARCKEDRIIPREAILQHKAVEYAISVLTKQKSRLKNLHREMRLYKSSQKKSGNANRKEREREIIGTIAKISQWVNENKMDDLDLWVKTLSSHNIATVCGYPPQRILWDSHDSRFECADSFTPKNRLTIAETKELYTYMMENKAEIDVVDKGRFHIALHLKNKGPNFIRSMPLGYAIELVQLLFNRNIMFNKRKNFTVRLDVLTQEMEKMEKMEKINDQTEKTDPNPSENKNVEQTSKYNDKIKEVDNPHEVQTTEEIDKQQDPRYMLERYCNMLFTKTNVCLTPLYDYESHNGTNLWICILTLDFYPTPHPFTWTKNYLLQNSKHNDEKNTALSKTKEKEKAKQKPNIKLSLTKISNDVQDKVDKLKEIKEIQEIEKIEEIEEMKEMKEMDLSLIQKIMTNHKRTIHLPPELYFKNQPADGGPVRYYSSKKSKKNQAIDEVSNSVLTHLQQIFEPLLATKTSFRVISDNSTIHVLSVNSMSPVLADIPANSFRTPDLAANHLYAPDLLHTPTPTLAPHALASDAVVTATTIPNYLKAQTSTASIASIGAFASPVNGSVFGPVFGPGSGNVSAKGTDIRHGTSYATVAAKTGTTNTYAAGAATVATTTAIAATGDGERKKQGQMIVDDFMVVLNRLLKSVEQKEAVYYIKNIKNKPQSKYQDQWWGLLTLSFKQRKWQLEEFPHDEGLLLKSLGWSLSDANTNLPSKKLVPLAVASCSTSIPIVQKTETSNTKYNTKIKIAMEALMELLRLAKAYPFLFSDGSQLVTSSVNKVQHIPSLHTHTPNSHIPNCDKTNSITTTFECYPTENKVVNHFSGSSVGGKPNPQEQGGVALSYKSQAQLYAFNEISTHVPQGMFLRALFDKEKQFDESETLTKFKNQPPLVEEKNSRLLSFFMQNKDQVANNCLYPDTHSNPDTDPNADIMDDINTAAFLCAPKDYNFHLGTGSVSAALAVSFDESSNPRFQEGLKPRFMGSTIHPPYLVPPPLYIDSKVLNSSHNRVYASVANICKKQRNQCVAQS